MLALVGQRGNGRSKKLAQWAIASGGVLVVGDLRRMEMFERLGVPKHQIATVYQCRDRCFGGQRKTTLYAIDDVDLVLQDLLRMEVRPQIITFYGGAMQP